MEETLGRDRNKIENFKGKKNVEFVVCFPLGNFLAPEFYMLTFRNILSVPSS